MRAYSINAFEMKRILHKISLNESGGMAGRWAVLIGIAVVAVAYAIGQYL